VTAAARAVCTVRSAARKALGTGARELTGSDHPSLQALR